MNRLIVFFVATLSLAAQDGPRFTNAGELQLPKDYREWMFLSSGLGMTYGPAASTPQDPRFDNVFVNPSSYRAFLETGRWPDKTMFILEIRRSVEKGSINQGGRFQSEIVSVEAAVKDVARFPQKWAYFGFGRGEKATAAPVTSSCNTCHGKNAAVENTFVQFYPTLLEVATRKGTLNTGYTQQAAGH